MACVLIVGCGYLGKVLGSQLLALGHKITATTRQPGKFPDLMRLGFDTQILELSATAAPHEFSRATEYIVVLLPPGTLGQDGYSTGKAIENLLPALTALPIRKGVLVSSTAVYGALENGVVDADSPTQPEDAKGLGLLGIEKTWLTARFHAHIVRLAGIYGPGRIIGAKQILAREALGGDPERLLNLIHVEDAASLITRVLFSSEAASIELGSDGHPITRRAYYQYLAQRLGMPVNFDTALPARTAGSRACDIAATCKRTGWSPRYKTYRLGLSALLAEQ